MTVLETERLLLRPSREEDLDDLAALYADAEVMRLVGDGHIKTREQTRELLREGAGHWREHGFGIWALHGKEDGGFVGQCGVAYLHDVGAVELAYTLTRLSWGRGLGTEAVRAVLRHAFEVVQVPRVVGITSAENVASQGVMLKAGMTRRAAFRSDGQDALLYAIDRRPDGDAG